MKGSLTTSAIVHVSALAFALISLGSPAPLEFTDSEVLPVELVPIEDISQIQQGDKNAPLAEKSAPVPTTKPNIVEHAENAGNNNVDLKAPPTPAVRPSNNESAAAPAKQEKPQPIVDTKANDIKDIVKEETSAPTEVASLPTPKPDVTPPTPQPTPQPPAEAAEQPQEMPLPDSVPLPAVRPKPEPKPAEAKPVEKPAEKKPETPKAAEKPTDKKPADKKQETAKATSSKESDFNADDVAALLNKAEPSGGGAKRSTDQAALGGKKTTGGTKLSQTEMDALRGIIEKNWSVIPGTDASGIRIRVYMKLDRSGEILGEPEVTATGGSETAMRTLSGGVRRAVMKSAPFTSLPADKYDTWNEVVLNFDPSSLL